DVVTGLHYRACSAPAAKTAASATAKPAGAAVTLDHGSARVFIRGILPAIPKLARLRAILENPGSDAPAGAIRFAQEGNPFFRKRNSSKTPFRFRELSRSPAERRRDRHHLIAKRHFVFQIAAIQRFGPDDR